MPAATQERPFSHAPLAWLGSIPVRLRTAGLGTRVYGEFALPSEYADLVLDGGIYHLKATDAHFTFDAPVTIKMRRLMSRDEVLVEFQGLAWLRTRE